MWMLTALSLPHFRHHRARTMLTLVGIALGVAAMVATTTVTETVFRAFRRTVEATAGRAELQVTNGSIAVPEELAEEIRAVHGVATVAPMVEGFVTLLDGDQTLAVFGF